MRATRECHTVKGDARTPPSHPHAFSPWPVGRGGTTRLFVVDSLDSNLNELPRGRFAIRRRELRWGHGSTGRGEGCGSGLRRRRRHRPLPRRAARWRAGAIDKVPQDRPVRRRVRAIGPAVQGRSGDGCSHLHRKLALVHLGGRSPSVRRLGARPCVRRPHRDALLHSPRHRVRSERRRRRKRHQSRRLCVVRERNVAFGPGDFCLVHPKQDRERNVRKGRRGLRGRDSPIAVPSGDGWRGLRRKLRTWRRDDFRRGDRR